MSASKFTTEHVIMLPRLFVYRFWSSKNQ